MLMETCRTLSYPGGSAIKNLPAMQEMKKDVSSFPGLGRSPEKGMEIHSSTLAWRIPWTEDFSKLQFIGSHRVRHN